MLYAASPELEIAHVDDENVVEKILLGQNRLLKRHKKDDAPKVCQKCSNFIKNDWPNEIENKFNNIQLNHYRMCNLSCVHCGYRHSDKYETDTPHEKILPILQKCIKDRICDQKLRLEVGGGEPSLAKGIEDLLEKAMVYDWTAIINSNGAKFSDIFAKGVNLNLFTLLLTPDAGSPETYKAIKGKDNFNNT